jgi:hypothetical protein
MTPEQLAELEVWLAAGFDLPTAWAAVGPDEDDSAEPADMLATQPLPAPPPAPSAWHYFVAVGALIALLVLVLRLLGS